MSDVVIDGLPYPVIVSDDAAAAIASIAFEGAVAVVADERVRTRGAAIARSVRASGGRVLESLAVGGGERGKSTRGVQALWEWLLEARADRTTTLIAVGGGTITDAAGFAAATYMRGLAWVAVPTTVLGMADAAIGGKTAIDLPQGKNLVGAFWPPRAVVADVTALATLPVSERATGVAEIVKAGMIGDPDLLDLVGRLTAGKAQGEVLREAIVRAARVKVDIVAADPREHGQRAALNLGHTIGHAVEYAARGRLTHGQAVAIGLRAAGLLALRLGMFSTGEHARVLKTLRAAGLPLHYGRIDPRTIHAALRADKKRRAGDLRFVLPERIGKVKIRVTVQDGLVRDVVRQCAGPPRAEELEE